MDFSTIFIKLIFLIVASVLVYVFGKIYYFYMVTIKSWQKTEGKIISSDFVYIQKNDSDNDTWEQSIKYKYSINGVEFTNNLITKNIKWGSTLKDVAKNISTEYKEGQKVTVTYNPEKPKESILVDKFNYYTLIFWLIVFLMLYYFIF